jgi:hypothetical protein
VRAPDHSPSVCVPEDRSHCAQATRPQRSKPLIHAPGGSRDKEAHAGWCVQALAGKIGWCALPHPRRDVTWRSLPCQSCARVRHTAQTWFYMYAPGRTPGLRKPVYNQPSTHSECTLSRSAPCCHPFAQLPPAPCLSCPLPPVSASLCPRLLSCPLASLPPQVLSGALSLPPASLPPLSCPVPPRASLAGTPARHRTPPPRPRPPPPQPPPDQTARRPCPSEEAAARSTAWSPERGAGDTRSSVFAYDQRPCPSDAAAARRLGCLPRMHKGMGCRAEHGGGTWVRSGLSGVCTRLQRQHRLLHRLRNNQQPTTNNQQPTTNNQQPTTTKNNQHSCTRLQRQYRLLHRLRSHEAHDPRGLGLACAVEIRVERTNGSGSDAPTQPRRAAHRMGGARGAPSGLPDARWWKLHGSCMVAAC